MGENIDKTIKEILGLTLKFDYTDFDLVSNVVDFCNGLYNMGNGDIKALDLINEIGWVITVRCVINHDGYDNEARRFQIERRQ